MGSDHTKSTLLISIRDPTVCYIVLYLFVTNTQ